jgi:hypothetical protein
MTTHIYKSDQHDPDQEMRFELDALSELSEAQILARVLERSRLTRQILLKNGHLDVPAIIKRT